MITLEFRNGKPDPIKVGEVRHLKVVSIYENAPGKWRLTVDDVTPLSGAEPTGYGCHGCGSLEPAAEDGSLPKGWVKKEFPERSFFLCPECQEDVQICRVCGCSNEDPCEDGCYWVEEDLCSVCEGERISRG